jgi:PLP dependent protein
MAVADGLAEVRREMVRASIASGRPVSGPGAPRLVVVTKTVPANVVAQALDLGVTDIGENRVQEAAAKLTDIGRRVRWHLIGHLQANKANKAAEVFDVVQSVDSEEIALALDHARARLGREALEVLLQVNVDSDDAKAGMPAERVAEVAKVVSSLPNLKLTGLMTIGRLTTDPDVARATFRRLRSLRARLIEGGQWPSEVCDLSMGMSADFAAAIEEGSTIVRVGSAVFGPRSA